MENDKPKGIFENAFHSKKKEDSRDKSSNPQIASSISPSQNQDFSHLTAQEMLNKMHDMNEELQSKLDELYEKHGLSKTQVQSYLDNPKNFPKNIWEKITKQREEFENSVSAFVKKQIKHTRLAFQEKAADAKARRAKTLGSRKNWIQM